MMRLLLLSDDNIVGICGQVHHGFLNTKIPLVAGEKYSVLPGNAI